jgi:hypothetical protein
MSLAFGAALFASEGVQAAEKRVGLMTFVGPDASLVREAARRALTKSGYEVVDVGRLEKAPGKSSRGVDRKGMQSAATAHGLVAFIGGRVDKRGQQLTATLVVREPARGGVVGEFTWWTSRGGAALAVVVDSYFWSKLGPSVEKSRAAAAKGQRRAQSRTRKRPPSSGEPAPAPGEGESSPPQVSAAETPATDEELEEEDDEEEEETEALAGAAAPQPRGLPRLEISVGPRSFARRFSYSGDLSGTLTPYRTKLAVVAVGGSASWFPVASRGAGMRLGLSLDVEHGLPVRSTTESGLVYSSPSGDYRAGLVLGLKTQSSSLDLVVGGGLHQFGIIPVDDAVHYPRPVPGVRYRYARGGLSEQVQWAGGFGLTAGVFYRHLLETGTIASRDWFPDLRVRGFESVLRIGQRWGRHLEVRMGADARWYTFALNTDPEGPRQVKRADDWYWTVWLAMALLAGG